MRSITLNRLQLDWMGYAIFQVKYVKSPLKTAVSTLSLASFFRAGGESREMKRQEKIK